MLYKDVRTVRCPRQETPIWENVERRVSRVDSPEGGPYNPPTADEAAPESADETSETLEIAKKFEISKRVLTGSRVSNTTRLADNVERQTLPPISDPERADRPPGNRNKVLFARIRKLCFHDVAPETGPRGQLFDIVKMEERETWTARFLRT